MFTKSLTLATIAACLGSVQYGLHMAELNAPEAVLSCSKSVAGPHGSYEDTFFGRHGYAQCVQLDSRGIGLVTSIFSIGGLVGALYANYYSEKYGRRRSNFVFLLFSLIGSLLETVASSKSVLCIGRFLAGIGSGACIVNTPLMLNEIASSETKGFLGSLNQLCINLGILLTQIVAIWWANDEQWRLILLVGALAAFANVAILLFADESPKWLAKHGRTAEARKVLRALRPAFVSDSAIDLELSSWSHDSTGVIADADDELESSGIGGDESQGLVSSHNAKMGPPSMWQYLTDNEYAKSRLVVILVMVFQQFCGINSIIFYGVSIISSSLPDYAVLINCCISILNVVVTFLSGSKVDKLGRKFLLLVSVTFMGCSCVFVSLGIVKSWPIITIPAVFIYISAFAVGLGPIPFLLISEVSPLKAATVAQSIGTIFNWLATFAVGYLFPIINNKIGGYVFLLFGFICALFLYLIQRFFPETKGKKNYAEVWGL